MPVTRHLAAVLAALLLACSPGGENPDDGADPATGDDPPGEGTSVVAEPAAELDGTCDPQPERDGDHHVLSADLTVHNTGNVGIVARVAATWPQPRGEYVTKSRRVRLELDESAEVTLRLDVSAAEARAISRAAGRGRECFTVVRVTRAFGAPRQ